MRFKYLRYLAFALGGLSTVVASGALYLKVSFDGPRLAAELTHFAKQRYQRTLRFEGPPQLAMFPRLELRLPGATLSGRNGDGEFLGVEHAAVGVRLMPLLAGRVVVDRIDADGLRVALWRGKDGKLNAADLFAAPPADTPVDFDVDRLGIVRGALNWIDDTSGRHFALSDIALDTDRLARPADGKLKLNARLTQIAPATDARLELAGSYDIDAGADHRARKLHLTASGALAGRPDVDVELDVAELVLGADAPPQLNDLDLQISGRSGDGGRIELRASAPELVLASGGAQAASAEASLRLDDNGQTRQLKLRLTGLQGQGSGLAAKALATEVDWNTAAGRLTGKLDTPARWQNDTRTLDLPTLAGKLNFAPRRAGTPVKIAVQAGGRLDFGRDSAAGKLDLRADDSRIQGSWSLSRLASPSLGFDLDVDRLDLDRYLGDGAGRKSKADDGAAPLDLSALTGADLDGVLRIASLKAGGLRLERLRLPLSLHGGKLVSAGHSLGLYGGTLDGALSLAVDGKSLSYRGYLQNANLAPLLHDASGREPFAGSLNFFVDVSTAGATPDALRRGIDGLARLRIRSAVLRGIDATAALKDWRVPLQSRQPARRPARNAETTALGELVASFQIAGSVARSTDLQSRSPALGVNGSAEIDLPTRRLDALARLTLLTLPAGPDGALLAGLRGVAVPIRVKATPEATEWRLEPGAAMPAATRPAAPPPAPKKPVAKPPRPAPKPVPKPAAIPTPAPAETAE